MNNLQGSLFKIQFGIFFSQLINRPDLISSFILNLRANIFNASPVNLALPDNVPVPPDLPISRLRSNDDVWHLNVSKKRLDVIFSPKENQENPAIKSEIETMQAILLSCADKTREQLVNISRIANITIHILRPDNPIDFLHTKLNIKRFNNEIELNLRFNQREQHGQFQINNITVIDTGVEDKKGQKNNILILTKDVNTVVEDQNQFSNDDIKNFLEVTNHLTDWNSIMSIFE